MTRFIFFVDELNAWVGKAFAWCIMVLTFATCYEVVMRYAFSAPTNWAFDMSYLMYGALFMMAGAYALSRGSHVRGDVFYRLWPVRMQAVIELVLYLIFFFPGILALIYAGYLYAEDSWSRLPYGPRGAYGEISINSPAGVPVSPLKTIIPVAAAFLFLQGIAEVMRCIQCLKTGAWPRRVDDVVELEQQLIDQVAKQREAEQARASGDNKS